MDAKQKAKDLVERFKLGKDLMGAQILTDNEAKQCALICIEREYKARLNEIEKISEYLPIDIYGQAEISISIELQEVKQEIINCKQLN